MIRFENNSITEHLFSQKTILFENGDTVTDNECAKGYYIKDSITLISDVEG